jgi:hypothetical protein
MGGRDKLKKIGGKGRWVEWRVYPNRISIWRTLLCCVPLHRGTCRSIVYGSQSEAYSNIAV